MPGTSLKERSIVDVLKANGSFAILVRVLRATGRIVILRDPDAAYTLFAPSDRAFKKLSFYGALQALLKDKARLSRVMDYHIVPSRLVSRHIDGRIQARTLNRQNVLINTRGGLRVNDANIIRPDLEADNGIIHEIDSVLMPK